MKVTNVASQFTSTNGEISKLWHDRYGHMNSGGLKLLSQKKKVNGHPHIDQLYEVCEACQLEKQHKSPFSHKSPLRTRQPLQLIHSDLYGSIPTLSLGGSRYFISFIDDFSKKFGHISFKEKSDCYQAFKYFKVEVEKFSGFFIKILRINRGTKYLSKYFEKLCRDLEIRQELTIRYLPQQNG